MKCCYLLVFGRFVLYKSHPFKFLLMKVIKDSISMKEMKNGMWIDIRNG
jgi:hypothetical protein